tara:strand:- start:3039 stop:3833 length:795 start_codon:yes stop_codon:yes gene_type:complete
MVNTLKLQKVTKTPKVKYIDNNRFKFEQKHIDKLAISISKFGSNINPVLLTKDNYILDGQNRVKAYEKTVKNGESNSLYVVKFDVNYKGNEDYFKSMLSEVNNEVEKWKIQDWLVHHLSNENYKKLNDLWQKYPEHNLSALRSISTENTDTGGTISDAFKKGKYVYDLSETKQIILDKVTALIHQDYPIPAKVWKQGAVLKALSVLCNDPAFDVDRMFDQISKNLGTFQVQSGLGNWCGYFKALHNKGLKDRSKKIKKSFIGSY